MIHAYQLNKSFRSVKALHNVSLSVDRGEICGILGPNGAGKTTLIKILCGLITPDSGSFQIDSSKSKSIGAIIEKPALFEYLTANQNLYILAKMQGASKDKTTISNLLELVGLPLNRKDPVKHFSLGMKQRLGIAIALLNNPDCLILDEPFLGLDPLGMYALRILIKKLAIEQSLAIMVSSHLLDELNRLCDTLYILNKGEVIQSGKTRNVINNSTEKYLICGNNLSKSTILKDHEKEVDSDCILIMLKVADAPIMLRSLINEGLEINFFGPERNVNKLYQGK